MSECLVSNYPSDWDEIAVWSVVALKGNNMVTCVRKLCLGAAVYHLWLQRNAILHGKTLEKKSKSSPGFGGRLELE
jgi:hypothetical protein